MCAIRAVVIGLSGAPRSSAGVHNAELIGMYNGCASKARMICAEHGVGAAIWVGLEDVGTLCRLVTEAGVGCADNHRNEEGSHWYNDIQNRSLLF